ncbi:nicotinamide mononucleotide transporter family protein [Lacunimicrobium album]
MSSIEWIAAAFGFLCVWLTIRQNVLCWPVGLVQVVLYIAVFYHARLYSDLLLHIFYVFLQFYGWYHWLYGAGQRHELPITRMDLKGRFIWPILIAIITLLWGSAMAEFTDASAPLPDAFIAVASLAAQWLLARKVLESWLIWIIVDIVAIGVFYSRSLFVTSGLYALFLVLAILGYLQWRRTVSQTLVSSPQILP